MARPQFKMRETTHFSLGAFLAICAGIASIVCSAMGKWSWGLGLGCGSLLLGLAGLVQSGPPRKRGGFPTLAALLLGVAGCVFAAVMLILHLMRR